MQAKRKKNIITVKQPQVPEIMLTPERQRYLDICIAVILGLFGLYFSINYFGHLLWPNSDFPCFYDTGEKLLNFHLPTDYKRGPVLGICQVIVSKFVHGQHPKLTGGWLFNAMIFPFIPVLLWLVGRRLIGGVAVFMAVVLTLNPYIIDTLRSPIAETLFLFLILATFYCILKGTRWSYFFAALASMTRYEAAALILGAFIFDMVRSKDRRQRLMALLYAFLASIPLMLWAIGTFANWQNQEATHYIKEIGVNSGGKIIVADFLNNVWTNMFSYLFVPTPESSYDTVQGIWSINKFLIAATFLFGGIYGICKRQWFVIILLIFIIPYVFIHATLGVLVPRYGTPIGWAVMLVCIYGMQSLWRLINSNNRIPVPLIRGIQVLIVAAAALWTISLIPSLSQTAFISPKSTLVPYLACLAALLMFLARRWFYKNSFVFKDLVILALACLMISSNQFLLVQVIAEGKNDIEFKYLVDWYDVNAKPGEKITCSMAGNMAVFDPANAPNYVHSAAFSDVNTLPEYIQKLYKQNITYVVWDSRCKGSPRYYKLWKLDLIEVLAQPQDYGPFKYVTTITDGDRRFLNVFRLLPRD